MKSKSRRVGTLLCLLLMTLTTLLAPASAVASGTGSGPDDALPISSEWTQIAAGKSLWYSFTYAGDESQIQVRLQAEPVSNLSFAVWTPKEVTRWKQGLEVSPVGRGAAEQNGADVLAWSGNFPTKGTYYVVVESGTQAKAPYYQLLISGTGVSTSAPAATPVATPKPVKKTTKTPAKLSGKLVFQTSFGGDFFTVNVDGTNLKRVGSGMDAIWSPDGKQIAFVRWSEPRGVYVVNADGSGERMLFAWHETRYPSWSADGSEIVFSRQHRGRTEPVEKCVVIGDDVMCFTKPANPHYNLGVVRVGDGTFWEPLPSSSERSLTPDWSPDGSRMVYADVYGLTIQSADGQTRTQLTDKNRDINPVWSPDGSQIAFTRRQHDHWEVYVINADGTNLRRLTTTPAWADGTAANSVSPAWSPDGSSIAFLTDRTGSWEIWVAQADGSQARALFKNGLGVSPGYSFNGERALDWTS